MLYFPPLLQRLVSLSVYFKFAIFSVNYFLLLLVTSVVSLFLFFVVLYFSHLALYSLIMRITLLSAQWAALSLRMASVPRLLKPQAVNRPCFTMRNQTSFVSRKQSAVLFWVWPTMRFLCVHCSTQAYTHTYAHTPPPLLSHVEDNLALGNKYFWKIKWRQANKKILVQGEAPYAISSVFPCSLLTDAAVLRFHR